MTSNTLRFGKFAAGVMILSSALSSAAADEKHVAITQIVEHPALDAVTKGVKDVLAENGYKEGANLKWSFESAQGSVAIADQIAKKFIGKSPDVIVAIATPSAQAVAASTKDIPLVFSAITDPLGAKLVKSMEKPGKNTTGVTDLSPAGKHVDLIVEISGVKKIAFLYNPGEANSVTLVALLKKEAKGPWLGNC
jgi:putative ABC transport system substrate-binding protein